MKSHWKSKKKDLKTGECLVTFFISYVNREVRDLKGDILIFLGNTNIYFHLMNFIEKKESLLIDLNIYLEFCQSTHSIEELSTFQMYDKHF